MAEFRAASQARIENFRLEYFAQYGKLPSEKLAELMLECSNKNTYCEKCTAECGNGDLTICSKIYEKFYRYFIAEDEEGEYTLEKRRCRHWYGKYLESQSRRAGLPKKYIGKKFSDYERTRDNERGLKLAEAMVQQKPDCALYFYGGCGTGKTFLASLIAQEYILDNRTVVFGDMPTLLSDLKRTFDHTTDSTEDLLDKYLQCDLLILDDFGVGLMNAWRLEMHYHLINTRYNLGKALVLTSNYDLKGLRARLGKYDDVLADRVVSRLSEMSYQANFGNNDRRPKLGAMKFFD